MTAQVKPVDVQPRPPSAPAPRSVFAQWFTLVFKVLIPLALLAGAAKLSWDLYNTAPVAQRQERPRVPRLVEVVEVQPATVGPRIEAWGEVTAARTLVLRPEVGGKVIVLSDRLTPGGLVLAGDDLIRLDDREQTLLVAQAQAEIDQIEARMLQEQGQQERAKRDLQRLPGNLTDAQRQLVLRAPQLAELQAELAAAEAALERARVDLSHMVIRAPFDALVIDEEVALGTTLTAGAASATLVAADRFHVLVAVPVSTLDWIDLSAGQSLRLTQPGVWPEGTYREGRVERLTAGLSATGRMAELVVAVDDPLSRLPENRGKPRLLLGSFLQALGEGRPVEDAVALERAYLRDDDTVWVMTADDKLEIRPVQIAWRGASKVLVSGGLDAGDRVITTPLAVVAPGMDVRLGAARADGGTAEKAEIKP